MPKVSVDPKTLGIMNVIMKPASVRQLRTMPNCRANITLDLMLACAEGSAQKTVTISGIKIMEKQDAATQQAILSVVTPSQRNPRGNGTFDTFYPVSKFQSEIEGYLLGLYAMEKPAWEAAAAAPHVDKSVELEVPEEPVEA